MCALTATITNITTNQVGVGTEMPKEWHLMYIDVIKEVNKIPTAQLVVLDGDAAKQEFKISNGGFFEPGKEIQIKLKIDDNRDEVIFQGIIVGHRIKADKNGSYLTVDLKDKAFKLTTQRKSRVFRGQDEGIKDSEIIRTILSDNGIEDRVIELGETNYDHQEIVQYYCTDWDFIISRLEKNGHWLFIEDEKIVSGLPSSSRNQPIHSINYGESTIYSFEMEVDIRCFHTDSQSTAWNISEQKLYPLQGSDKGVEIDQGNKLYNPKLWMKSLGLENFNLISSVNLSEGELGSWAFSEELKSRFSLNRGHIKINGNAAIKLGDLIQIEGIGDRFNGITIATGIRHQVDENGWQTDVQFGLSADWFSQRNDIVDTPAAGLLPAINGLHIGIVESSDDEDPEGHYRVKVRVPAFSTHDQNNGVVWARLTSLYAGWNRGAFFRPEVGDEVVLGFFNDDPRQAVILGAMHSSKKMPPEDFTPDKENSLKGFVTRKGIRMEFREKPEGSIVQMATPEGNVLFLNDHEKMMGMVDQYGNSIVMDKDGIRITSEKDVAIKARENGFSANSLQS